MSKRRAKAAKLYLAAHLFWLVFLFRTFLGVQKIYYIKRKLPRISHFLHTEFGSKVIARRLGPRRGPTRVFSNRNCARPAVSRCRVPCDMWPKTPWQHCVAVFSRNPIPAIIAALTFYHSFEPPPSWSSLPPIFWPPSDA